MTDKKAISDEMSNSLLATTLRGDITYVIPYLVEVDDVQNEEDYTLHINSTLFTYTSSSNATEEEILKGLRQEISIVSLEGTESGPFDLEGLTFDVTINGVPITVDGLPNGTTATDFASELTLEAESLNLVGGTIEEESVDFEVQVTSGDNLRILASKSLEIGDGDANAVLGFTSNTLVETPEPALAFPFTDKDSPSNPLTQSTLEKERLRIKQDDTRAPLVVSNVSNNLNIVGQEVYIALFTSITVNGEIVPSELSEDGEPDKGYHRVKGFWTEPLEREIELENDVVFGEALEDWGEITHYAVYDQLEGGRLLVSGPISVAKFIMENDFYIFRSGDVGITLK